MPCLTLHFSLSRQLPADYSALQDIDTTLNQGEGPDLKAELSTFRKSSYGGLLPDLRPAHIQKIHQTIELIISELDHPKYFFLINGILALLSAIVLMGVFAKAREIDTPAITTFRLDHSHL